MSRLSNSVRPTSVRVARCSRGFGGVTPRRDPRHPFGGDWGGPRGRVSDLRSEVGLTPLREYVVLLHPGPVSRATTAGYTIPPAAECARGVTCPGGLRERVARDLAGGGSEQRRSSPVGKSNWKGRQEETPPIYHQGSNVCRCRCSFDPHLPAAAEAGASNFACELDRRRA